MSGLETAIRNALERSDRSSAEIRARIYQSARQALETGLRKQDINDPETVALQRQRLERVIHDIEGEERGRLAPAETAEIVLPQPELRAERVAPERHVADEVIGETRAVSPNRGKSGGDLSAVQVERVARHVEAPATRQPERMAETSPSEAAPLDIKPDRVARRSRRGAGIISALLIYGMLLGAIGGTAWWVMNSGLVDEMKRFWQEASTENDGARPTAENGQQFSGLQTLDPQSGFSDDWIEVFKPGEISRIKTNGKSTVEAVSDGAGPSVRITSNGTGDDGTVGLEIPPAVLQALAGKRSTIALTLRSASQNPTQVVVECAFASLGNCGRHRFTVTEQQSDVLFQVVFDRSMAPSSAGALEISSDLEGKGKGVYLSAARILPGQ